MHISADTKIKPHCSIHDPTQIGHNNRFINHTAISGKPQNKKYTNKRTKLIIDDNNVIREFITINRGTHGDDSQAAIDRSKIRLQRLGYFESVEVETPAVPGSNDQVDVVYNVKETTSGSFVVGLGYSQSFGVTTSVQLSQNNFLGGGNRVAVEASRSSYQQRYAFSYTNPFFTDDGVSLGYNLS